MPVFLCLKASFGYAEETHKENINLDYLIEKLDYT